VPPPLPPRAPRDPSLASKAPSKAASSQVPIAPKLPPSAASAPPLARLPTAEQRKSAAVLTHHTSRLLCMVAEQFSTFQSLRAEAADAKDRASVSGGRYRQNQLLEELRLLRDSLARERRDWAAEREAADREMAAKRRELARAQVGKLFERLL